MNRKSIHRTIAMIVILILALWAVGSQSISLAGKSPRERAVVEFNENTKLMGVILKGEYVFVHDEERMAKGEPCSYVYKSRNGREGELVTSFHCQHMERTLAKNFVTRIVKRNIPNELPELQEFQFAGSAAGHRVPGV